MSEPINSLQNTRVKLAYGLQTRPRTRAKEQKITLEGTRLIRDALERGNRPLFTFYDPASADYELVAQLQALRGSPLLPVTTEVMRYICDTQQPQGMLAVFPMPNPDPPRTPRRVLILDAIREPGNMGTILRAAAASGVDAVILAAGCVDPYNPKVLRAGMGAHFRVPLFEATWGQIATYTEGLRIFLADASGEQSYTQVDWPPPWALIIGNEAHGISQRAEQLQGQRIAIPMAAATESINAAMAAAVILFEAQRQRLTSP